MYEIKEVDASGEIADIYNDLRNSLNIKKLSKNSLHLVTIGPYDSKKIAEQALKDISQKIQLNSFIISE